MEKLAQDKFPAPALMQVTSSGEIVEYRMASIKPSTAMEKQQTNGARLRQG